MAMSINKVFISGRIKGDPYEVAGRHRQFTRFRVVLPRERNRGGRGDADSVLVEAVGRNGAQLLTLRDGAAITFEGRLRSTVIINGDNRESTILVRLENFSINFPPAETEDSSQQARGNNEERPPKQRRRRNNRRRKNNEDSGDNPERGKRQSQDKDASKAAPKDKPPTKNDKPAANDKSAPADQASNKTEAPKQEAKNPPAKAETTKAEAPKAPSGPPEMPSIKSVADESLKKDMPF